jgi:hypothetical protein
LAPASSTFATGACRQDERRQRAAENRERSKAAPLSAGEATCANRGPDGGCVEHVARQRQPQPLAPCLVARQHRPGGEGHLPRPREAVEEVVVRVVLEAEEPDGDPGQEPASRPADRAQRRQYVKRLPGHDCSWSFSIHRDMTM